MTVLALSAGDVAYWGLAIFLVAIGLGSAFMLFRLGQTFERLSSLISRHRARPAAGDREDRRHGRPRQLSARQGGHGHRQRRLDGRQRRHGGACRSRRRSQTPVEKVSGLAAGISHGFSQFRKSRTSATPRRRREEAARRREADLHEDLRHAGRTPMEHAPARPRSHRRRRSRSPTRGRARSPFRSRIRRPRRQDEPTAARHQDVPARAPPRSAATIA